jgi:hypothetical protein
MRRWFLSCATSDNLVKHLLKHRQAFNPDVFRKEEEKMRRKKLARLQNTAAALGYRLIVSQ